MPSGTPSSSVPTSPNPSSKDRSYRVAPAGPRKRADTKSDVKPSSSRPTPSSTASENVTTVAGPSTSSISASRSESAGSENIQRKEMMVTSSRSKSSTKDAQTSQPHSSHSHFEQSSAKVESPSTRSPVSDSGRYGTIKTTSSPTSSPTFPSPLSASLGQSSLGRLGPNSQRSYESFGDFRSHSSRRTTGVDPQVTPSSRSHLQGNSSPGASEGYRVGSSSSRAGGQASASLSRKSSVGAGTGSDREGGGHLDLKRLLSKPALPSHSGSSIISLPSDPEPSASHSASRRLMTAQAQAHDILRQRSTTTSTTSSTSKALRDRPSARSMSALAVMNTSAAERIRDITPRGSVPVSSRELEREREREREREQVSSSKSRAVLKRRPSARSGNQATVVNSSSSKGQTSSFNSNETARGSSSSRQQSSDTARATAPPSSSSRRNGTTSTDAVAVRGLKESTPPTGLTPAGAVAHAYKQQEERREKLAEATGWTDQQRSLRAQRSHASLSSISFTNMASVPEGEVTSNEDLKFKTEKEEPKGPYYSVFGSSSDHLVAANRNHDDWNFDAYYGCSGPNTTVVAAASAGSRGGSSTGVKGLTRKMSGKLRKATGGGKSSGDDSPHRGIRVEKKEVSEGHSSKEGLPYDGRSFEVKDKSSPTVSTHQEEPAECSKRSHRSGEKEKHKSKEEEGSAGGKLWKLMKRISTGGLRDKYTSDPAPPPVPALPKDLPGRLTLDIQSPPIDELAGESGVLLSRFMLSRSSMSGVRPSSAPGSHASTPTRQSTGARTRPSTGNKTDPRPSTTTRSSSPDSSEVTSAGLFHKGHSNRSSTTSYGDELPPLPNTTPMQVLPVAQHILSPSEQERLDSEETASRSAAPVRRKAGRSRSAPDDVLVLTSPTEEPRPSLPFPPRRQVNAPVGKPISPPSPTIPTFNTAGAVNNFPSPPALSLTMSEFGVSPDAPQSAPPRPRKSSRRQPSSPEVATSSGSSPSTRSSHSARLPSLSIDVFSRTRRSISTISRTAAVPPPITPLTSSSHSKSPLTFRDMESPRAALSEKEKAAKWDDLLEKSARAGGTLHLGETGLMSDSLRYSVVSEG
ncbi:hypothetical protein BXZ70DRAFT_670466 [Cristinia sonorae]|uniref:Uncharacterized protein n=1 Tax=Cristinia sonorae TaxID=1940300 RepID=A0A8K0UV30_9AGAR|nr:hypothetical protein BXZ70DRAFT_670466 [Cristinia sonorae]